MISYPVCNEKLIFASAKVTWFDEKYILTYNTGSQTFLYYGEWGDWPNNWFAARMSLLKKCRDNYRPKTFDTIDEAKAFILAATI